MPESTSTPLVPSGESICLRVDLHPLVQSRESVPQSRSASFGTGR